jgi:hypothetical protein
MKVQVNGGYGILKENYHINVAHSRSKQKISSCQNMIERFGRKIGNLKWMNLHTYYVEYVMMEPSA